MKNIPYVFFFAILFLIAFLYVHENKGEKTESIRHKGIRIETKFNHDFNKNKRIKPEITSEIAFESKIESDSILITYVLQSDAEFKKRFRLQVIDAEGYTVQDFVFLMDSTSKSVARKNGNYVLTKIIPNETGSKNVSLSAELMEYNY